MAQHLASGRVYLRRQAGFSYLLVLLLIVLIGIGLGAAGTLWRTESQRLKEAELLFIGEQYRKAIRSYYSASAVAKQYPKNLEDLLLDSRQTVLTRHLRKLYPDPVTGKKEWGLIMDAESQQVSGVYSLAQGKPIKQLGFDSRQKDFENAESYGDWRFVVTGVEAAPPPESENGRNQAADTATPSSDTEN